MINISSPNHPWQNSVRSFLLTLRPFKPVALRAAEIIHEDRMDREKFVQEPTYLSTYKKASRFGIILDISHAPMWCLKKNGVLLGSSFRQVAHANPNQNGLLSAFKSILGDLRLVRPDGSTRLNLGEHIATLDLSDMWKYYHRHKHLPKDGIMLQIDLSKGDIDALSVVTGKPVQTDGDGLPPYVVVDTPDRGPVKIAKGHRMDVKFSFVEFKGEIDE